MTRNKAIIIIVFLIGIFIGFLIGGTLVYHQYEEIIKGREVNGRIDRLLQRTEDLIYLNHKEESNAKNSVKKTDLNVKKESRSDSLLANDEQLNELLFNIEKNKNDTISQDSLLRIVTNDSEEVIVLKKDVLLDSKKIPIIGFESKKAKKSQYLDSLLTDDVASKNETGTIVVEFWESPLNYRGYKMNKTKLVLFGMVPTQNIVLKKLDNNFYLEYDKRFYSLIYTNEFLSYQLVTNEMLIKQLRL